MRTSIHDKLNKVRKPRVHISYEVETNGAVVEKELPFVVGVMGDFSGDPTTPLKPLKDRRFVQIDRDNFDQVLASMNPGLNLKVDNKLDGDGDSEMAVELSFNSMEDFEPAAVVQQVEPLRRLMETRNKLRDLSTKADRSEELEAIIERVLTNDADLSELAEAVGVSNDGTAGSEEKNDE
ncbi:type VI secretion system contractile sheath small subunit [Aquisalimonas lutea]|uniref:type VI secretion system contractile sheath small subunit n=1 Tax=Aquisalimonas lutea TaxID=1327750 RepID=UPI0025B5D8E3|nr:type VI secretion system contractile sheath small subunit [Aquisalimonas lutea]MDN3519581.1 type VI secretion system contractile sheath small subunit [Aquisalimonas lutea]